MIDIPCCVLVQGLGVWDWIPLSLHAWPVGSVLFMSEMSLGMLSGMAVTLCNTTNHTYTHDIPLLPCLSSG
jgi:hypothetical protein